MAIDQFIPEIWAAGVTQSFISNQVVIPTLNTQFTGEITRGNQVHIINATTPTIVDYAGAGRSITAADLADTEVLLAINQEKAFSVNVDDVDKVQASSEFGPWVDSAGRALAEDAEEYILAQMLAGATDGNADDVDVTTFALAKAALLKIRTTMTAGKVPASDRFVAVNPAMADLLISGLSDVSSAGSADELRNGQIARLYGMGVLETPLFAEATAPVAIGYHASTVAFVNQINSLESLRNPTKFADIVRGLNVYGAKVTQAAGVVKYVSVPA